MPAKSSNFTRLGLAGCLAISVLTYNAGASADTIGNAANASAGPAVANVASAATYNAITGASSRLASPGTSISNINHSLSEPVITSSNDDSGVAPPPPVIQDLQEQSGASGKVSAEDLGLHIRTDAIREAALSYGARGGLAARTFEIQRRLAEYDASLSKAFDFSRLLMAAPTGLLIETPIVTEAQKAVLVKSGGQAAAVADRIYRINQAARIVTASRNWRLYLERDWGKVESPPGLLLPKDDQERLAWRDYIKQGWDAGVRQAEETFENDVDRLTSDFVGMVRYRELLAQGMISAPYALADDRGVTGGGSVMRVGDRGLTITGPSALIPRSDTWTPAAR